MKLTAEELRDRAAEALGALSACTLCGHRCGAARDAGATGKCKCGSVARVASATLHPGEEPALSSRAGAIFFSRCNLRCVYCQNWQISQEGKGHEVNAAALADMMLRLRDEGAANVELVSPTPWIPQTIDALAEGTGRGLGLPVAYNTGGYESPEALRLLDGVVDVYLPDLRYSWGAAAERFSGAADYPRVSRNAVLEMYRQVGDLVFDEAGHAVRGLLVRLLVLPNGLAGTRDTLAWMAANLSRATWFSLMAQYAPAHRAMEYFELARPVNEREYHDLLDYADELGFENFYTQSPTSRDVLRPDFERARPFDGA